VSTLRVKHNTLEREKMLTSPGLLPSPSWSKAAEIRTVARQNTDAVAVFAPVFVTDAATGPNSLIEGSEESHCVFVGSLFHEPMRHGEDHRCRIN
jgi:hypothetical protein